MATRSMIYIDNNDGTCTGVYCHFDGYPKNQLAILQKYYDSEDKVRDLIGHGAMSYLGTSTDIPNNDMPNGTAFPLFCKFYYRDIGEKWASCKPETHSKFAIKNSDAVDYSYVFKDGTWTY